MFVKSGNTCRKKNKVNASGQCYLIKSVKLNILNCERAERSKNAINRTETKRLKALIGQRLKDSQCLIYTNKAQGRSAMEYLPLAWMSEA